MINIGIRYFNKDGSSGVILAGDTAAPDPTTGSLIIEGSSFVEVGEFPIAFAANALENSAIISDFTQRLQQFLDLNFKKPSNFNVAVFKQHYYELHGRFNDMAKYYSGEPTEEYKRTCFDFILAGSDKDGQTMLYYGNITDSLIMEDIGYTTGYITTKMGQAEGMAFLSAILKTNEVPKRVAEETAVSILEMLSKFKSDMSKNFKLHCLEKGEILPVKAEALKRLRGFVDYRWNAVWSALKNSLKEPRYVDYLLHKYWGQQ